MRLRPALLLHHYCAVEGLQSLLALMRELVEIKDSVAEPSRQADMLQAFKVSGACARVMLAMRVMLPCMHTAILEQQQ